MTRDTPPSLPPAVSRIRALLGLLIPLIFAAGFVALGFWQLSRHGEVAARNKGLLGALEAAAVPLTAEHLADTVGRRFLRVRAHGRFRYDLEQVQAGRTSEGSPGVHLMTPLEIEGVGPLVVVTRGWVYSPNASDVQLARWREADTVSLTGYLLALEADSAEAAAAPDITRPLRTLTRRALETRIGRPVAPLRLVMTSDSLARADSVPKRLPPPRLDNGPHLSYAFQWFGFALIAVVGGWILFSRVKGERLMVKG